MITLTRTGLLLTLSTDTIPAQGSSDVPISFVNDPETYSGYTIQPLAGWYKNGCKQSAVCRYADGTIDGTITVPAAAFQQGGEIMLAIALIDPSDPNHIEVTQPASAYIIPAPTDPTELPDEDTWQAAVDEFVTQVMQPYQTNIQSAIDTANAASQAANEAASTANAASQAATNTSNAINEAIEDGDFIPQISATATQGAEGTQPSVTVTGDKARPSINFTIPKGDTGTQGPQGEQGIQGPKGDTGAQGPAGPSTITDATGATIATAPLTAPQNLLINGDFKINQRGQSSYTADGGTVDVWIKKYGSTTLTVTGNGVNFSNASSEYPGGFYQKVKKPESVVGSKFTIVAKINGSIFSKVKTIELSNDSDPINDDNFILTVSYLSDGIRVYVEVSPDKSISIEYIDLFEGSIAYPHVVEDYATALMRCERYLEVGQYVCYGHGDYWVEGFTYRTPKADVPTITIQFVADGNGTVQKSFETVSPNSYACPFIRLTSGTAASVTGVLNVAAQISCEP